MGKLQYRGSFKDGLCRVKKDGKWGYINTDNNPVIPIKYDFIEHFDSNGLVQVVLDNKWGYINKYNTIVLDIIYDYVDVFIDGLCNVSLNGMCGIINNIGKIVIPLEYDDIRNFKNGKFQVKKDGKWGAINKDNEIVIPFKKPGYNSTDHESNVGQDIWPLVIVSDRYRGTYSGGLYTAWNMTTLHIPKEISGSDMECADFWDNLDYKCGIGSTPEKAIIDLKKQL